ncbi:hypothetical protein HK097_002931 [Rhizophlyctis rosea]|uniref:Uncharacterized protein n=1 Tax=Rhizophlyctis rosea TaxID=64517 RepID=A0AAD5WY55_9FUNG|nr:hypothetical protein HK097_002931 [Rhizophlyctis rosea]
MEGKGDKARFAKDIIGDVSKRLAAEEEVLGGVYQKLLVPSETPPRDLYKEWVDGHYRLKVTLQRLEALSGEEPSFDQEIRTLAEELRTQTNFEASEIIPHLEDLHLPVEPEDVELALRVAEESISPHPHPNAPMTPPAVAKIANRVLKFIDQGRDKVSGSLGGFIKDGGG